VRELVMERPGVSGVVYVGTRDGVDALAEQLAAEGVPALAYHAGLDKGVRSRRLEQFLQADAAVMVATIAFGMGVDKPDVRYVIHADPPASIEAYWQEVGRAGRDGAAAEGITLYSSSDMAWAMRRIESRDVEAAVKTVQARKLRQVYAMLDGTGCRPAAVRRYFGESAVEACGVCDICRNPPNAADVTEMAQKALSAVHRLGGRFGRGRVVDHLTGKTSGALDSEMRLSTFGIGRDVSTGSWRDLIEQLLFEGLLRESPNDGRPLIGLGDMDEVRAVYRGTRRLTMRTFRGADGTAGGGGRPARARKRQGDKAGDGRRADRGVEPADAPLFEALRLWRRALAAEQKVPPYVIFHDTTLAAIARRRPANTDELARISGVGQAKLERYGADVLRVVAEKVGG
jgi:ATP-dependent DNA helicase RecQ